MGKLRKRQSFSHIDEILDMPDLIEVQKNSYRRFLEVDMREVLDDVSPIVDYTENLSLEFVDYSLDEPKNSVERCKERDMTYAAPLKVFVRLKNRETGEIKESDVFMGDFPLMTEHGTFIINGAERVIVSQLVRSPGVYYEDQIDKAGKHLFSTTVIPNRGAWLEYETDSNDVLWVRIDRARKLPITLILRALGYGTDQEIVDLLGEDERLMATLQRGDNAHSRDDDIRLLQMLLQIRSARMADRHGCVAIQQQHGDGNAHDVAATNHNRVLSRDLHTVPIEQLDAALGSAGHEQRLTALHGQLTDVEGMETIHVLLDGDGTEDSLLVDVLGERELDEDSVYTVVSV